MTNFLINGEILAKGEMTLQQEICGNSIVIKGIMELDQYIDDISQIDTEFFTIVNVTVTKETFGTKEKKVVYEFEGKGFGIDIEAFNSQKGE